MYISEASSKDWPASSSTDGIILQSFFWRPNGRRLHYGQIVLFLKTVVVALSILISENHIQNCVIYWGENSSQNQKQQFFNSSGFVEHVHVLQNNRTTEMKTIVLIHGFCAVHSERCVKESMPTVVPHGLATLCTQPATAATCHINVIMHT